MTFAALSLGWVLAIGAATSVVVVVLYLLQRMPRPQIVSSVDFWVMALEQARPRALRSTRIPWLSLLMTLLVALLMVILLGGPRFGTGVRGTTVLVLSADQSMGAVEDGLTRSDRAIGDARRWVERAASSGRVAVLRAGIRPSVLVPLTDDTASALQALEAFEPDDGAADLDEAVRLANAMIEADGGVGQILVLADRAPTVRTPTPSVLIPIGGPADTVAITALAARRDPDAVGEYTVHVEVSSFASQRAEARLLVRDRDVVIFDQPIAVGSGERSQFSAQGFSSAQGEVTATLEEIEIAGGEDALPSDDRAFAIAPALSRTRVLLVTEGNVYLERVLDAHPGFDTQKVSPGTLASLTADDLAAYDVVILDRVSAEALAIDHPAVMAIAAPGARGVVYGHVIDQPRLDATLASHPALGGIRLDGVLVSRAGSIEASTSDSVLVRSGRHALAIAREEQGHRTIALGFDLMASDLGERIAFPLFMHHAVQWLRGGVDAHPLPHIPGEPLVAAAGSTIVDPTGSAQQPRGGHVDDTTRAGIYHVGARAAAFSSAFATAALPAPSPSVAPRGASALPPLALFLGVALLVLIVIEWLLLQRGRLV